MEKIRRFVCEEEGATAIEYGLIAGLIAIALAGAMTALQGNISTLLHNVGSTAAGKTFE